MVRVGLDQRAVRQSSAKSGKTRYNRATTGRAVSYGQVAQVGAGARIPVGISLTDPGRDTQMPRDRKLSETLAHCVVLEGQFDDAVKRCKQSEFWFRSESWPEQYGSDPHATNATDDEDRFRLWEEDRRKVENLRTDLAYQLFKADVWTQALPPCSNLPDWGKNIPVLLEAIQRVRARIIGRTNPSESENCPRAAWETDIQTLVDWSHRLVAFEKRLTPPASIELKEHPTDLISQVTAAGIVKVAARTIQRRIDGGLLRGYGAKGARKVSRADVLAKSEQILDSSWKPSAEQRN